MIIFNAARLSVSSASVSTCVSVDISTPVSTRVPFCVCICVVISDIVCDATAVMDVAVTLRISMLAILLNLTSCGSVAENVGVFEEVVVNLYKRERFTNIVFGVLSDFEKVFHCGFTTVIHKRCTALDVDVVHLRFAVGVN